MTSKTATRQRAATRMCKPAQLVTCVNAVIVALTLGMHLLTAAPVRADEITLVESGSTLIHSLFSVWATEYMKTHPDVRIVTNSTGSDQGIKQAISGAAHIGTSDAYMSDAEIRQNPQQIINVAMAISAQTINYNLPDLNAAALKLDGPVLAGIHAGRIRAWDDKAIAALNPASRFRITTLFRCVASMGRATPSYSLNIFRSRHDGGRKSSISTDRSLGQMLPARPGPQEIPGCWRPFSRHLIRSAISACASTTRLPKRNLVPHC